MYAQYLAILLAHKDLADAIAALILGNKATCVCHRECCDLIGDTLLLCALLGKTHTANLRICIDNARNSIVAHTILATCEVIDNHLALAACRMCKQREACNIARSIYTRNIGAHLIVHLYSATIHLHTEALQTEASSYRTTTHADKYLIARNGMLATLRIDIGDNIAVNLCHLAGEVELDTPLCIDTAKHCAQLLVKSAQNLRQHLDNGNLCAEAVVEACELHTDNTATDNHKALGLLLECENLAVGKDNITSLLKSRNWRHKRLRAGTYEQVCSEEALAVAAYFDTLAAATLNHRLTLYHLHAVCLHLGTYACNEATHYATLSIDNLTEIECGIFCKYAILVAMNCRIVNLGTVEQRLCRDTTLIEADSAQLSFLKKDHLKTLCARSLGCYIAGRTATNNRKINHYCYSFNF